MTTRSYIGIGSNLGEPQVHCQDAVHRLGGLPESRVTALSPWYLSRPVGVVDQGWFVNGVARLETRLTAGELLQAILGIEADMGRVRKQRWEARIIDLDLLLYGTGHICEEDLTVPHPRLHLRRFVLVPLKDLDPVLIHPVLGRAIGELLEGLDAEGQDLIPLKAGLICGS
ncbi:MAG: 2-amino-4-hydroxy-6-hydroxymethyldihydropteridine diphosphokinase [Thermodesulfobacteriota bacterium]